MTTGSSGFGEAFSRILKRSGTALSALQRQLEASGHSVSLATLSYWRAGRRRPEGTRSLEVVAEIEKIFGLMDGELSRLVGSSTRIGRVSSPDEPLSDEKFIAAKYDVAKRLGYLEPVPLRLVSASIVADVDERGRARRTSTRVIIQPQAEDIVAMPFIEISEAPSSVAPILTAISGGRFTAVASDSGGHAFGAVFEFTEPVRRSELRSIELLVEYPDEYPPVTSVGHATGTKCRQIEIWVRFHAGNPPEWVVERVETPEGLQEQVISRPGEAFTTQRRNFGPGRLMIGWGSGSQ